MKFYKICALTLACVLGTTAYADLGSGVILMKKQDNNACFYNGTDTKAANFKIDGVAGCPYIDSDGKVYVSVKGLFSAFGDSSEYMLSAGDITITVKGKKCKMPVEKKFMVRGHEDKGYMYVYKIYNDYYIPAELIAIMCGGSVVYDKTTDEILLFTDNDLKETVVSGLAIKADFYNKIYSKGYLNSINKSNLYLKSNGTEIASVKDAESVVRSGETLYYTRNYKLYKKYMKEDEKELKIYNKSGNPEEIYACNLTLIGNRLYGISTGNAFGVSGRLFSCNLDGKDFYYISTSTVKNLIADGDYLYYISDTGRPVMYLYDTELEDEYELIIIDDKDESMIDGTKMFAITKDGCVLINDKQLKFLRFDLPAYECEWINIREDSAVKLMTRCGTKTFNKITAINYDDKENSLYVIDNQSDGARLIKINCEKHTTKILKEYTKEAVDIDLFDTNGNITSAVVFSDGSVDYIK